MTSSAPSFELGCVVRGSPKGSARIEGDADLKCLQERTESSLGEEAAHEFSIPKDGKELGSDPATHVDASQSNRAQGMVARLRAVDRGEHLESRGAERLVADQSQRSDDGGGVWPIGDCAGEPGRLGEVAAVA